MLGSRRRRRRADTRGDADAPLLSFEDVTAVRARGRQRVPVLERVSLEHQRGELLAVLGRRGSGRTTLLRLAAGIDAPAHGRVRVLGADPARGDGAPVALASRVFAAISPAQPAVAHVEAALLPQRLTAPERRERADALLEQLGAPGELPLYDLAHRELTLVALARALASRPRLLLVDDPLLGVGALDQDAVCRLLRELARDAGVLVTGAEPAVARGADRVLHLSGGALRGEAAPALADVIPIGARPAGSA